MNTSTPPDYGIPKLLNVKQFPLTSDRPNIPFGSGEVVYQGNSILAEIHGDIGSLLDVRSYQVTLDPRRRAWPGETAPEEIIPLPFGYGLYWESTSGNTWTYNPSVFFRHGPEGVNLSGNGAYMVKDFNEGAFIGVTPYYPGRGWWAMEYKKEFDKSRGGEYYYFNDINKDFRLDWWLNINDTRDGYGDNYGFMNANIVVFRI